MQERVFRVTPLTPVHVGTGEVYSPEEYRIEGGALVRLNLRAILASWSREQRRRFESWIEANKLLEARRMVGQYGRERAEFELYRVALAPEAKRELEHAEDPARRRGEVHPLYRNPVNQDPILPGSSVKGAIRTAIVNACAAHDPALQNRVRAELGPRRKTAWQMLEEGALRYKRSRTESDPLSFLRVSDGVFPPEAVRIDRILVGTRREPPAESGIQMHFERLVARCDGGTPPSCTIRLALDDGRMRRSGSALELSWDFLIAACEAFYRNRYDEEVRQFEWLAADSWLPKSSPPGGFVLRVGRFCHFESLSVDKVRSGWNAQGRRPIVGMGSSRSVVKLADGKFTPFGWVLLEPAEAA